MQTRRNDRNRVAIAALTGAAVILCCTQSVLGQSSRRSGLSGVPARLPNVLGFDRSLPIERQITLPGLPGSPTPTFAPGVVGVPAVVGGSYGYAVRDGVSVDARYEGDRLSLDLHLGTDARRFLTPPRGYRSVVGPDGRCYYIPISRGYYYPNQYYLTSGTYFSTRAVDGGGYRYPDPSLAGTPTPVPAQAAPAPELTDLERASLAHRLDELDIAIRAYRDHLEEDPEDMQALRALGLALLESGDQEDAIATLGLAYHTDPALARTAADLESLGITGRRFDSLLGRAMGLARRLDSGRAWLAGLVLLQADDKLSGAARVLREAERAGLEMEICEAFEREIGRPAAGAP